MICLFCDNLKTRTTNSRPRKDIPYTWRRHTCDNCGATFTTEESPSLAIEVKVMQNSGEQTPFSTSHLIHSIIASFAHDKQRGIIESEFLAMTIKQKLFSLKQYSFTTKEIAAITHETLTNYDKKAALQYAALHDLL